MRKATVVFLIAIVGGLNPKSQEIPSPNIPPETKAALDKIDKAFDENLKGWTRERTTPFQPSSGLQERWQTDGRTVRVFISKLGPATAALYKDKASGEPVEGLCDEARVFGYDGNISCRHGQFGISISSDVHLNLLTIDEQANRTLDLAETKATNRLIACFVNLALSDDLHRKHRSGDGFLRRPCEQELLRKGLLNPNVLNQF